LITIYQLTTNTKFEGRDIFGQNKIKITTGRGNVDKHACAESTSAGSAYVI